MSNAVNTVEQVFDLVFSDEELGQLDMTKVPKHIAIIMDGSRRWAKQKQLPYAMGHWEGAEVLTDVLQGAAHLGVKTLTVYAFSTENWNRPGAEVEDLMNIFQLYLKRKKEVMIRDGVKLGCIGDINKFPERVKNEFFETQRATLKCDRINLVLALNYGGRDEIRRAVTKIIEEKIPPEQITEDCIAAHLDTGSFGDPELIIRAGGEMRLSNFLLWQASYAEFFSTEVLWPDFSAHELRKAVITFQNRSRRLGG